MWYTVDDVVHAVVSSVAKWIGLSVTVWLHVGVGLAPRNRIIFNFFLSALNCDKHFCLALLDRFGVVLHVPFLNSQ